MIPPHNDPADAALGEALAAELQFDVERYALEDRVRVGYVADRRAVRLAWSDSDDTLDVPATEEWVERVREALPRYARAVRSDADPTAP